MGRRFAIVVGIAFLAFSNMAAVAQEKAGSGQNAGATAIDITRTLLSQIDNESFAILGLPLHSDHEQLKSFCDQLFGSDSEDSFHRLVKKLESAGIRRIVCVASFSDFARRMPGKILVTDTGTATIESIDTVLAKSGMVVTELESVFIISKPVRESVANPTGTSSDIAFLDQREAENATAIRLAFSKALPAIFDSGLHVTIVLGPDQRRVLHEFLPSIIQKALLKGSSENQLPNFDVADFVADFDGMSIVLGPDSQGKPGFHIRVDWANEAAASAFSAFAPVAFDCFAASSDGSANEIFQKLAQLTIAATAADKHVDIRLVDQQGNDATNIALDAAGIEGDSMRSRNDLRDLALAFHTYHDAYRHLPTIGSRSDDGKPQLSWRVHILPFLNNHRALYEQFHLDEPWDSEHNKTLIEKMPAIFLAPRSQNNLSMGLSNYSMPNGKGAMFRDYEPVRLQDISDGTSRTAMIVEVNDASAEIWTRPGGWSFDPSNPSSGLGGHIADRIHIARGDGSTAVFAPDYPGWQSLITSDASDIP